MLPDRSASRIAGTLPWRHLRAWHLCSGIWQNLFRRSDRASGYVYGVDGSGAAGLAGRRRDFGRYGEVERIARWSRKRLGRITLFFLLSALAGCRPDVVTHP